MPITLNDLKYLKIGNQWLLSKKFACCCDAFLSTVWKLSKLKVCPIFWSFVTGIFIFKLFCIQLRYISRFVTISLISKRKSTYAEKCYFTYNCKSLARNFTKINIPPQVFFMFGNVTYSQTAKQIIWFNFN